MANIEIAITEADLSAVVTQKVSQCTNLEIQLAALSRTIQERDTQIAELKEQLTGSGLYARQQGEQDAESR